MNTLILTASIPRGKYFYENTLVLFLNAFKAKNIKINLDDPPALHYLFDDSYEKLKTIGNVRRNDGHASFLDAFKWLVSDCDEYKYIWWMEDDWKLIGDISVVEKTVKLCEKLVCKAFSFCDNAPMGSFKAGPLMDELYFKKYFSIVDKMNNTCDPEKQVRRWCRGGLQKNGDKFMLREVIEEKINLIFLFNDIKTLEKFECFNWYYTKEFNRNIHFTYYKFLLGITEDDFLKEIKPADANYITVVPGIFVDAGRDFNIIHSLKKWEKASDKTTYQNI